jgi:hypothetical protein
MTTIAVAPPSVRSATRIWPLARIEAVRYARHPLFLVGLVLAIAASAGERGPIELDFQVIPSFFIGVFGIFIAARLTASTDRSGPVVDAAPVSQTARTAALCLACAVPGAAGILIVLLHRAFVLADPIAGWKYGTYGATDRFVITMIIPVIACIGGPLLGVAVARWLRFPGAALFVLVTVVVWSNVSAYVPDTSGPDPTSLFARTLHLASPYTAFGQGNGDGKHATSTVDSYTGSPLWFAVWTLSLCGLAVCAALWRAAATPKRSLVGRTFIAIAICAVAALVMSIAYGNDRVYKTFRNGTVSVATGSVRNG